MAPRNTEAEQEIENLREVQELAQEDLAQKMGGPLTPGALRALVYWIARAWEMGRGYERKRKGG